MSNLGTYGLSRAAPSTRDTGDLSRMGAQHEASATAAARASAGLETERNNANRVIEMNRKAGNSSLGSTAGSLAGGVAAGAMYGSAAGPWGAAIGAVLGAVIGNRF